MSITRDTLIEDDLGVSGDDVDDLIIAFGNKHQVDIKNFSFSKYFTDEPSIFDPGRLVYPLTVGHLEKAIISGRLDEKIINR